MHPNDDVNKGQSSNDVFPTAMHVAAVEALSRATCCRRVQQAARHARRKGRGVRAASSRSAAPTCRTRRRSRSGRRSRGWVAQLDHGIAHVEAALPHLCELALGGTAVGTGLNAHPEFARARRRRAGAAHRAAVRHRAQQVRGARRARRAGARARRAQDAGRVADEDRQRRALAGVGSALRHRRAAHPRERAGQLDHAGQGQPDAVRGADHAVRAGAWATTSRSTSAARSGNFELNVFKPLIIHNFLQSVRLLADGCGQLQRQLRRRHRARPRAHRRAGARAR